MRPREEGVKEGEGREGGAERRRGTRATVERGKEENERTPYFCFTVSCVVAIEVDLLRY